ncbi:MAG: hypothetical protein CVV05_01070 [Gammaproteobacteria bacterium HGW-Gammaproteobacteria-1]|jgi:hypothetical protein|nr:MAG: hypothetical protein CVV05_01070 [Gammaproteobacteria bacterium HGW-Gammaproteobacteria-1]
MENPHWNHLFVPAAKACHPGVRKLKSFAGDPPKALDTPPALAQNLLCYVGNGLALTLFDRHLVPFDIVVQDGQPTLIHNPDLKTLPENAHAVRQLAAFEAWSSLGVRLEGATLDLSEPVGEWLRLVGDLPDNTLLPADAMVPFLSVGALVDAGMLSAPQAAKLLSNAPQHQPVPNFGSRRTEEPKP